MEDSGKKDYSIYPEGYRELRKQIDEEHERLEKAEKTNIVDFPEVENRR